MYRSSATTILVDVGRSMSAPCRGNDPHAMAKREVCALATRSIIQTRMLASKTHEFGVVLFGCEQTANQLSDGENYLHCVELVELNKPDVRSIEPLSQISQPSDSQGDLVDALIVALNQLGERTEGKKYNREIVLLTDAAGEIRDVDDIEAVVTRMQELECVLNVCICGTPETHVQVENSRMLSSIAQTTGGSCSTVYSLDDILSKFVGKGVVPRKSKITFELTKHIKLPAIYYGKTSAGSLPTLKKQSMKVDIDEDDPNAGKVKIDRVYRNPDNPDEEVGLEDRQKGFKYGKEYIPVMAEDEDAMKFHDEPCVRILGFTSANLIPRHYFMSTATVVAGAPDFDYARVCISALAHALRRSHNVAICRFVKTSRADPVLGVLMPDTGLPDVLLLHILPCAEDFRDFGFPSFQDPKFCPPVTQGQKDAVTAFVTAHTLTPPVKAEGETSVPAPPFLVFDPVMQRLIWEVSERCLETPENAKFIPEDPTEFVPPELRGPQYAEMAGALRAVFELKAVEKKESGKRKTFWSDVEITVPGAEEQATKHARLEDEGVTESKGEPLILNLASLTPVEDFEKIIKTGSEEDIRQAMEAMQRIIHQKVTQGATKAQYRKALECIQGYRIAAASEGEGVQFNTFLGDVKTKYSAPKNKHRQFWEMLKEAQVTLLTSQEDSSLAATPEDAQAFLTEQVVEVQEVVEEQPAVEEDDLFGEMA